MYEKVEVLYNFEKGMTIAAVKIDYNEIMYTNIQQDATIMLLREHKRLLAHTSNKLSALVQ
jgi:uncharacterized membrane protein YobD (UPF0266 family)